MPRPSFIEWATSRGGMYLHDKAKPTLATWDAYEIAILNHIFPASETDEPLPYNRIIWSRIKKSGKTELAAAVHQWFGWFVDTPGEQYVLANDFEGAKSRVWRSITGSMERNKMLKGPFDRVADSKRDWSTTGSEIRLSNGTTIKAIASDYRGEAGSNHSLATVDEPWGIVHENALRLMTEFSPVPTRPSSTIFYTGYQGFEGVSNFWHDLIDVGMAGEPVPELAHLDNGDGQPACWSNGKVFVYWDHAPRKTWQTPAFMDEQKRSFGGRMNEYLRVWENRRVKNTEAFVTEEQWDLLRDGALRGLVAGDKRPLVLAADAATKADCCALVGVTWNAETKKIEVLFTQVWEPMGGMPIQLTKTLGPKIVELRQKYNVIEVAYDPFQMAAIAEECRRARVTMTEFPQTTRRIQADTHLRELCWGNNLSHLGDPVLKNHVTNAMAKANERGVRIVKEMSSAKVDAAVALSMACLRAIELLAKPHGEMTIMENPFYK